MEKGAEQYSDTAVIQKILDGETALFEILIRRNNPVLYKAGRAYNFNHEDTQDLMQDSFVDAYTNLAKFEQRSSFKTWLLKIMLNNCYRKHQKFSVKYEVSKEITEGATPLFTKPQDVNKTIMYRELNVVIEKALQQLPLEHRMVYSLRALNGLNVLETAGVLNISEANVKVRLNRAKAMLRKEVERSYSTDDIFEFNLVYCDKMVNAVMSKITSL